MGKIIKNEKDSRAAALARAREYGLEEAAIKLFNRYDNLLKGCKTEAERKAVAHMGIVEFHELFGGGGNLIINGVVVKDDTNK